MSEKLLKIIKHYGVMHQLKYFQSEVFELNEAIINCENGGYEYDYEDYEKLEKKYKEHITEEIADVMVLVSQFKKYYCIDDTEILKIMNEKIERQLNRIKGEKNGK